MLGDEVIAAPVLKRQTSDCPVMPIATMIPSTLEMELAMYT
jgi:hypothetical protein